jgi:hypothetical protein
MRRPRRSHRRSRRRWTWPPSGAPDARGIGAALRRASDSDHRMAPQLVANAAGPGADDRRQGAARQDRPARAGVGCFRQRARTRPRSERKAMIDDTHALSITRQARLLGLSRASVYTCRSRYRPPSSRSCGASTRCISNCRSRGAECCAISCGARPSRSAELMFAPSCAAWPSLRSISGRRPRSRIPHPVSPYLLRTLTVTRPNHVWAADLTYIPTARRLRLPRGHHGLGESDGPDVARLSDPHRGLLRGRA